MHYNNVESMGENGGDSYLELGSTKELLKLLESAIGNVENFYNFLKKEYDEKYGLNLIYSFKVNNNPSIDFFVPYPCSIDFIPTKGGDFSVEISLNEQMSLEEKKEINKRLINVAKKSMNNK